MLWGLDSETWLRLWGGAIGSLVSATVGGLVALLVVRLTNRNQTRLALEAREKAAMSEVEAAATQMALEFESGRDVLMPLMYQMLAAASRWRIESAHPGLGNEISAWPAFMAMLVAEARNEKRGETGATDAQQRLKSGLVRIQLICSNWYSPGGKVSRDDLLQELNRMRTARE